MGATRRWSAYGLSTLTVLAFGVHAETRDMTLLDTVTTQSIATVAVAPDGQHAAYTKVIPRNPYQDEDGTSYRELWVTDAEQQSRLFLDRHEDFSQVSFSDDGDSIYYLSKRGDDQTNALYQQSLEGGAPKRLLSHDTKILSYAVSADEVHIAFRANAKNTNDKLTKHGFKAKIYEEDLVSTNLWLATQADESVSEIRQLEVGSHLLSVNFRPNHEQLILRTAPTSLIDDNMMSSSYRLVNFDGTEQHRFTSEGKLGAAHFSPDGRYLAVIRGEDYNDPANGRLYVYDAQQDFEPREVLPDYKGHVRDITWQGNDELVWLGHRGTESEVHAVTLQFLESRELLSPGQGIATSLAASSQQNDVYVLLNKPEHPNELFVLQRNELRRITNSNPWLANINTPEQTTITYNAEDGTELEGVLVYPQNYQEDQQYPLIMVVHGGPEAHYSNGWLDRYGNPVKFAASQGYALFFPNYRGSTGRGVAFSKLGQNDYAGKEFDDLVDGKNALVERGLVDADRVGITGGSYGGFASAWGATAHTEHYAASVMFVGISNNLSKFGTTDIAKEMHAVHARSYPWEKWQWYLERSPIYHAEQSRTPTLILHGEEDTRVHPSQSMELYRYLKTHGNTPVRLVLYPGEGHGNQKTAAQLDYSMRLMRWMDNFLKEGATDAPAHELPHAEQLTEDAGK